MEAGVPIEGVLFDFQLEFESVCLDTPLQTQSPVQKQLISV